MTKKFYIEDFCEDLNYRSIILYIGEVDKQKLLEELKRCHINKLYRFEYITKADKESTKDFMYIENCDLQDLSYPVHEYVIDGYNVYILKEDKHTGKYYIDVDMFVN